jgi:hypothetical protein
VSTRPANYVMKLVWAAGLPLLAAGCAYAGITTVGGTPYRIAGFAFAAVALAWAYVFYRWARPPRLRGVALRVEPPAATPGAALDVTVEPVGRGGGTVSVGLVGASVKLHRMADQASERRRVIHEAWHDVALDGTRRLRLELPPDAPPTEVRDTTRTGWAVVVRRRTRLRFDARLECEVEVRRPATG